MERIGLAPGSEVGGYTVVAPLGAGGGGTVYRVVDGAGNPAALKLVHSHLGPAARDRLRREVEALQRLRHPGIAAVLDAEMDSADAFIVTELVDGTDLAVHVARRGPLGKSELLTLSAGLHGTLRAVHAAGVVHRDLTPANVMVTDDGPVLIDFGIAMSSDGAVVTDVGQVIGTPGYLAPEVVRGQEASATSDWWGWAAVLAFAATGRPPFGVGPADVVLARVLAGQVDLDGLGPVTSFALQAALDPDPAARPRPVSLVDALTDAAAHGDLPRRPVVRTSVLPAVPATLVMPEGDEPTDGTTAVLAPGEATAAEAVATAPPPTAVLPATAQQTWWDPVAGPQEVEPGVLDDGDEVDDEPDGPQLPRRWGSVAAVAAVLTAAATVRPVLAVAGLVVGVVVCRTAGEVSRSLHRRRARLGQRPGEGLRMAVATPWLALVAIVTALPALLVGLSSAVIVAGGLWWLRDAGVIDLSVHGGELDRPEVVVIAVAAAVVGLAATWWGPASARTRRGARVILGAVAPGGGAAVVVLASLAGAGFIAWLVWHGASLTWAPAAWPHP